jgi:nucleoid-associated protein EbfC
LARRSMRSIWNCWSSCERFNTFRFFPSPHPTMDIMKMMQQAQQMQGKMAALQDELAQRTVTGSAGGGMVSVEADGKGSVKRVKIDPSIAAGGDVELLEDLITVAVQDAQQKAAALGQEELAKLAGGLGLPAGLKLPFM